MIDVLVFIYENYWRGDACPAPDQLGRRLSAAGFEVADIALALDWLGELRLVTQEAATCLDAAAESGLAAPVTGMISASETSMRIYSAEEQDHLGAPCLGFASFLERAGILPAALREIALDRAMAMPGPVSLEDFKIVVLMVFWSIGREPDVLVLDELCDDLAQRIAH
jgi:Smg protein